MADGKIEIDIDVNDSGASAKGKKAGEEISKGVESGLKNVGKTAESAAKDTEKSFKSAADSAKSSFSDVGSAAKSGFSDVGDAAKTAAGDASSAFENVPSDASGAFSDVSSEAEAGFEGVTDAAKTAADDTASAFDGVGDEIASDIDGVDDKAQGVFGTNIPASTAIAGAAVGVLASQILEIGKNAVDTGMEFDKSMSQVAATMGVATDEVQDLRKFAQEMGETTAFSASQSADALNYMALAGYDAETSMRVLPTVLNLAAAGSMDLAAASDMVTDAQSALGLSVDEAETMVDQMAKTSSKTNTSVSQLGDAFLTVGGTAKNLKGGTAELSQMLGILADNGVKGSEGGTALRNVILSLSAPTDKAADAIKELGLQVFDAEGNMRSMPDIMNDMNAAMADMSQEKRTNVLNNIFNKVDLKSVNALLGTSADRFDEVAGAIDNAQGAAAQMAETQLDNLAGDVTLLESATEGFYIAVSDALTPALRGLTQFGTNTLMPFLTEGVKNFDKMAPAVLTLVTAIIALATKGKAVNALNSVFGSLTLKVNGTTVAFKNMKVAQKASAIATKSASVAMNALKTAAPILAITALVELGTMLYQTWQKDKEHTEKLTKATSGLQSATTSVYGAVEREADAFDDLSSSIDSVDIDEFLDEHAQLAERLKETSIEAKTNQSMLSDYADTISELGGKAGLSEPEVARLTDAVAQVNEKMGTSFTVTQDASGAYQIMAEGVEDAKAAILELIEAKKLEIKAEADRKNYEDAYAQYKKDLDDLANANAKVAEASRNLAQAERDAQTATDPVARAKASADMAKYNSELKDAQKNLDDIKAVTGEAESTVNRYNERVNLGTMALQDNASALVKNADSNDQFIAGVQGAAVKLDDFVVALQDMGYTADDVANMSQDSAMRLAQAWKDGYDITKTATDETVDDVINRLDEMGGKAYDAANGSGKEGGKGFADGVGSTAKDTQNSSQSLVNTAENTLGSGDASPEGQALGGSYASGVGQKEGEVGGQSTKLGNAATSDLDRQREAETAGSNVGSGFINGIGGWIQSAANKAAELANSALQAAKSALGIQSPSKVFQEQVGKNVALGLAKGIQKNQKQAKKSATEMSEAIVSAASKRLNNLKGVYNISIDYEIGFWKQIKAKTKKGTDAWYQAWGNLVAAQKRKAEQINENYNKIISYANNYVSRQRRLYSLSYQQEANYWAKILKKVKKGSSQYAEAYDNYLEAKKNAAEEVKEKNADLLDAEQEFVNKVRDIQKQLTDDIKAARDAYAEAVADRKQTILSDLSTFEIYRKKVTISGAKLLENIKSQVQAAKDYEAAMKKLESRIGKGDLYNEIADMGMDGLRYAESLNKMTTAQLKEFTKLYSERNAIAQREATRESKDILAETNATIKKLNTQAANDVKSAAKELKNEAASLGTALANTVAKMATNVKASANSISKDINNIVNSLKKVDKRVSTVSTSSSTRKVSIEPSEQNRVTAVPIATVYNGRQVITDETGAIQGYSLLNTDLNGATRQTEISLLKGMEALTIAMRDSRAIGGDTTNYQTLEFNMPVSSPDEIARTMRMQNRYGLAGQYL